MPSLFPQPRSASYASCRGDRLSELRYGESRGLPARPRLPRPRLRPSGRDVGRRRQPHPGGAASPTGGVPREKRMMTTAVVDWLLDSDPSIRWQVLRDLTGAPEDEVSAERARVATEGVG